MDKRKKYILGGSAILALAATTYFLIKESQKFIQNIGYRRNGKIIFDVSLKNIRVTIPMTIINRNKFKVGIQGFIGEALYGTVALSNISIEQFEISSNSEANINIYADAAPLGLLGDLITIVDNRMLEEFYVDGVIQTSIVDIPYREEYTWKDILLQSGVIAQKSLNSMQTTRIDTPVQNNYLQLDVMPQFPGTSAYLPYNSGARTTIAGIRQAYTTIDKKK